MKKSGLFAVAVFLSLSAGVFAAGTNFDQDVNDILNTVETLKAPPQGGFQPGPGHNIPQPPMPQPIPQPFQPQPGPQPQPWHPQPGPGHDNHGGGQYPGHDNHGQQPWDNNHGGPNDWDHHGGPNDWDHHHPQPPYNGPTYECSDWTFKSDTPNPFSNTIYFNDGQGQMQSQKVTINIGAREIKPWESEIITVCPGSLSQDKSLFNYSVTQKDTSGFGSFFTGTKSYEYTLAPTGRKTSAPDSQGLNMVSGGAAQDGKVNIILSDKWASYYLGQQVTFNVKVMRVPTNVQNMSAQDLMSALKETDLSVTYPVSSQYQIQLFDQAAPGTYMVTVDYMRDGTSMDQIFTFAI